MAEHTGESGQSRFDEATASHGAKLLLTAFFTLLLSLSAQSFLKIPMPPDGVPQTLQTLVVVVAAMGLGGRWGMASVGLYLLIGALGAGVFSDGSRGMETLLGFTGGYLLGFFVSQPVIAWIVRRKDGTVRGWGAISTAMLAGHAVVFVIGVPWLTFVLGREDPTYDLSRGIEGGLLPFLPGMVLKSVAAVLIGLAIWPGSVRRFW
ncbi:MAG: biotin transporter BioY [Planctomycetota bacterium]